MSSISAVQGRTVFVTGASGFIGSRVLRALEQGYAGPVVCLARNPQALAKRHKPPDHWRYVEGDLQSIANWSEALAGVDTVVHLAAATGKATAAELERINVQGTRDLLAECRRHGVRRMVYVSSIAAIAPQLESYPYGRSKFEAERCVRESGVPYSIVRPTIVLAADAPNWGMLLKMASLPAIPVLGGGRARIQPIEVDDVARGILLLLQTPRQDAEVIDLGGPEVLTFAEFLLRIRRAASGRGAPLLYVPATPMRLALTLAERVLGARSPVGPGQLVPLVSDGVATENDIHQQLLPQMRPLVSVLESLTRRDGVAVAQSRTELHPQSRADLEHECRAFTRYLTGREPDEYVMRKYVEGQGAVLRDAPPVQPIDKKLLKFAAAGPVRTRIADAYSRIFRPFGLLRRKLIFTFALLENSGSFHREFTSGSRSGAFVGMIRIGVAVVAFVLALAAGLLRFGLRR